MLSISTKKHKITAIMKNIIISTKSYKIIFFFKVIIYIKLIILFSVASPFVLSSSYKTLPGTAYPDMIDPVFIQTQGVIKQILVSQGVWINTKTPIVSVVSSASPHNRDITILTEKPGYVIGPFPKVGESIDQGRVAAYILSKPSYKIYSVINNYDLESLNTKKLIACITVKSHCLPINLMKVLPNKSYISLNDIELKLTCDPDIYECFEVLGINTPVEIVLNNHIY